MTELEMRLAALSKLVASTSPAIQSRLGDEMRRVEKTLSEGTDYDDLIAALKTLAVLSPKFHGAVLPHLTTFVRSVRERALTIAGEPMVAAESRYRSAEQLIREAIGAAASVSYLHTSALVDFLLELCLDKDDEVRSKAEQALEKLAQFDLDLFYGEAGIGARLQGEIVHHLSQLSDGALLEKASPILRAMRQVLSASLEGHSWNYSGVTIRRGGIVSGGGVAELREAAIALLKRMYPLSEGVPHRKAVLNTLDVATRRERADPDPDTAKMFERDGTAVLRFLLELVPTEALPVVQSIEHHAYWDYYHAPSQLVRDTALEVRDALDAHTEYQIYKQLIGFEGIFGKWEELRSSESAWAYGNEKRQAAARDYLSAIDASNRDVWRDRILRFAETQSDDLATFPVFYEFLEGLGRAVPSLALELLTAHEDRMRPFLIPLIGGLWESDQSADVEEVVRRWLEAGEHLTAIAKSVYRGGIQRLSTLQAVVARSVETDDRLTLMHAMGVAARLHEQGAAQAKEVFLSAMRYLARQGDASWARTIWFNRDFVHLIRAMEAHELRELLASLATLPELGYEAEELLSAIAKSAPDDVLAYLFDRLKRERMNDERDDDSVGDGKFEAIPDQLTKLNKALSLNPDPLIQAVRRDFEAETAGMFPYSGSARLMKAAFPGFELDLQTRLIAMIETGDPVDLAFVLAVLHTYGGGAPILEVGKAVVRAVPENSRAWQQLASAIETTGVVWGEYGMAELFERKTQVLKPWLDDADAKVRAFAAWLIVHLERMSSHERERATEEIALRKHRFGGSTDEN